MIPMKVTSKAEVLKNSNHNIFCSKSFLELQSKEYGWIYNEEFFIPFYISEKYFFRRLIFTSDAVGRNPMLLKERKQIFIDECVNQIKNLLRVDFISCSPTYVLFETTPKNSVSCDFGTYIINLKLNKEDLYSNLHSKHRNVIKKSMKNGVKVCFGVNHLNDSYKIINNTHQRQNITFPTLEEINKLTKAMEGNILCVTATIDDEIQGAAIILWNKLSGQYLYGGSISKPYTGAMNYLQWEVILKLKSLGVKEYNLVGARINPKRGSKIEGIQRFKSRFGAELQNGYLWKHNYNRRKAVLYNILILVKTGRFSKDIIDNEK